MKDALIITALSLIPKQTTSRFLGNLARGQFPPFILRPMIRQYASFYGINQEEMEGKIEDYDSLVSFFTRRLKPGLRPVDDAPEAVVSPVDGKVHLVGQVEGGRIPQAPEMDAAVREMVGGDPRFEKAKFAIIYLSPKDYHRVHTPREGRVTSFHYLPGRFWPVFPGATRKVKELFSKNERLVAFLDTDHGAYALVMVAAFGVSRIVMEFTEVIGNGGYNETKETLASPWAASRAQEIGRFEMGSTVVLLFEDPSLRWSVQPGDVVRVGQRIASIGA